jgi:hypothetical protein
VPRMEKMGEETDSNKHHTQSKQKNHNHGRDRHQAETPNNHEQQSSTTNLGRPRNPTPPIIYK